DQHGGDVDALRAELARHALREEAQAPFGGVESGEAGAGAQAARRAGEEDRAAAPRQHAPRRLTADEKAAQAALAPGALEILERSLGDRSLSARRGDERHRADRTELRLDALEELYDLRFIREVGGER